MFNDGSIFCIVGTVMCGPLWSQGRNGRQTLEGRISVRTIGANGSQREDVLQVRFWRGDLNATARLLVPGARIMVTGGVGGRLWNGDRGEKIFTDLNADRIIPLEEAQTWQASPPVQPPPPQVTDADIRQSPPQAASPSPDYTDTPF